MRVIGGLGELRGLGRPPGSYSNYRDVIETCGPFRDIAITPTLMWRPGRNRVVQLMRVLAGTDPDLAEHGVRTGKLARRLGFEMGMTRAELDRIEASARLHDIGKLLISREILDKPGAPTEPEWVELRRHPRIGFEIVRRRVASKVAQTILTHHERYDGTGYPSGLAGTEIPVEARILQVADAFDAITSVRPYQPAMPVEYAICELTRCAGTQFDPKAVAGIVRLVRHHDRPTARPQPAADAIAV